MSRRNWTLGYWRIKLMFIISITTVSSCEFRPSATRTPTTAEGTTAVFALFVWNTPNNALDILFVPDDDYGDLSITSNRQAFLDDVANLIDEGFWQNNGIVSNIGFFNFWYVTIPGNVSAGNDEEDCPDVTWPNLDEAAFTEARILVHKNDLRDCRNGRFATTEPGSYRTVVHESSHALFNLPDEYSQAFGYRNLPPVLYETEDGCNNDPINSDWRDCQSITSINDSVFWRSEDNTIDIMSGNGPVVLEYGEADWVIVRNVLTTLFPGLTVYEPSVLAPDSWDWP